MRMDVVAATCYNWEVEMVRGLPKCGKEYCCIRDFLFVLEESPPQARGVGLKKV